MPETHKRGRGRPRLPVPKVAMTLWVHPDEAEAIRATAAAHGKPLGETVAEMRRKAEVLARMQAAMGGE
jgi:hypothetical protein